jgi:hypothetical protein
VISMAFDSSIFSLSASKVGLLSSNCARTFSQVQGSCAWAAWHKTSGRNRTQPRQTLLIILLIIELLIIERPLLPPRGSFVGPHLGRRTAIERLLASMDDSSVVRLLEIANGARDSKIDCAQMARGEGTLSFGFLVYLLVAPRIFQTRV